MFRTDSLPIIRSYCLLAGSGCSILIPLADSITCMTYTYCCVYSTGLPIMYRKPVRNM